MRFYRAAFWFLAVVLWAAGLAFCLTPHQVRAAFGHENDLRILFQLQGLIYFALGCGLAWVAERPGEGIPIMSLTLLLKFLVLGFNFVAFVGNEIGAAYFRFTAVLSFVSLPLVISYFFWYYHKPRPTSFVPLIGIFGEKK